MERQIRCGDVVKHFKGKCYKVLHIAKHVTNGFDNQVIVYQALYGDNAVYVRDYTEFLSEVDHEKYPNVIQKYRMEVVQSEKIINKEGE